MAERRSVPPIVYILVAAVIGMGGYIIWDNNNSTSDTPVTSETEVQPSTVTDLDLRILGDTFSGYSTFRSTEFQQTLAELGIQLQYDNEFDQAQRAQQLGNGQADLIVTTLDQFLQQQPAGQIIALIDRTVGADAVVLNSLKYPQLTSINDLDSLISSQSQPLIATYAADTPSEYLALVLDTKFETFNLSDFRTQPVSDASEAWALLQDPDQPVALAVIWEPFVAQARNRGYTVVLSSQDAPRAIVDVLVASETLIESQPETLSTLVETYYRRIDTNVRDPAQLQAQIATDGQLSDQDAAAVLNGIDFFTALEAKSWFEDGTLDRRINSTAAVLTLAGRLNTVPEAPSALYTDVFLERAARNNETLIELIRADNPELADRLSGQAQTITPSLTPEQIQTAPDIGNLAIRGDVQFATGSASLTAASETTLNQLSSEIGEFSPETVAIRVIGHTSRSGAAAFNQTLSQQRAQVVVDYLKQQGITHNILAEGQGFNQPLAGLDPANPQNQRTEIRLVRAN